MTHTKFKHLGLSAGTFLVATSLWALVSQLGIFPSFFLPTPLAVGHAILDGFTTYGLAQDIWISVVRISGGFIVASITAIPIGIWLGLSRRSEALLRPLIDFIRYTPISAIIPLLILWFGIGETEKMVVIALAVFFQLVLMVANSIASVPLNLVESAQTLGATKWQTVQLVMIPYAAPRIVDDLRISVGWAWSSLILAEIVGSTVGVGYVIIQAQRLLQTAMVIGGIVIVGILGVLTDSCFSWYSRHAFPWVTSSQKD